jgi:hypothetical protein
VKSGSRESAVHPKAEAMLSSSTNPRKMNIGVMARSLDPSRSRRERLIVDTR